MPLIIFEWKVSFRLIDNNFMNLTRAIKLPSLFSSKSSTPAGACLLRLVIENFLEMMADDACLANSFYWCANSSSSEIGSSLKVCCDSIPTIISGTTTVLPLRHIQVFPDKKKSSSTKEPTYSKPWSAKNTWTSLLDPGNTCANRNMKIFSQ